MKHSSNNKTRLTHYARHIYNSQPFVIIIIFVACALRLSQYLFSSALWFDEVLSAYDIIHIPVSQWFEPTTVFILPETLGFLTVEKIMYLLFGSHEHALRFPILITGILSVFLFWKLSVRVNSSRAVPIAMGVFAASGPLIYYSSELKNYSLDVLVSLSILLLTFELCSKNLSTKRALLFGILGGLFIFFSIPAIFVLAGAVLFIVSSILSRKRYSEIKYFSIICLLWFLSITLNCLFYLQYMKNSSYHYQEIMSYWKEAFAPFPFHSFEDFLWVFRVHKSIFQESVGLYYPLIALFLFVIGFIAIFRKCKNTLVLLTLPIIVTFTASIMNLYPISFLSHDHANTGRVLLFLVPILICFIAEGVASLFFLKKPFKHVIGPIVVGLIFVPSIYNICNLPPIEPHPAREIVQTINYLKKHWRENDIIYVDHKILFPYNYYSRRYNFDYFRIIEGSENGFVNDMHKIIGVKRIWFLNFFGWRQHSKNDLSNIGEIKDSFKVGGMGVYLYDLSNGEYTRTGP